MSTREQTSGIELTEGQRARKLGGWEGLVVLHDDFDAPPDDLTAAFAGELS